MALFNYKAVTPAGETTSGQMEAESAEIVIARLQESGNLPISADPVGTGMGSGFAQLLGAGKRVGAKDIGLFTQQLATLLRAGLPLDRALSILGELAANEKLQNMITAVRDQVRGGTTLSEALESQHGTFSRLYINMVRAGEAGGNLDSTLTRLADYLKRSKALKDSVVSAMIYPALLFFMAIGSLFVLLTFVIPKFEPIFDELGGNLPILTQIVLAVGAFLQSYWWAIILAVLAVVVVIKNQFANPESRLKWDANLLKLSLIGGLLTKVEVARLSRTLGTLLVNGVPLLSALSIGKNVMTNTVMANAIGEATKDVKTGDSLAHTLAKHEMFPRLALQMINVGEETGRLDEMLLDVADTYDEEVQRAVDRMLALLVPALVLTMALLIATIVLAILFAILKINELVG